MTKILLVDSDTSACLELAHVLAKARTSWTINTASSGQQALDVLFDESVDVPVDVIVGESQLVDMSGFQLLDQARKAPKAPVRFTLTADAGAEAVLGNLRVNQRFLMKPLDVELLATSIERSLILNECMNREPLKRFMRSVTSIPAIPAIYDEMMQELASPHSSLLKVGDIVESDAGLTLSVLKVVNSAFYGINRRVESVGQAVTLLGVHMIKNITLTTKVFSRFSGSKLSTKRLAELNEEAVRIGAMSNQFARYAKMHRSALDHCQIAGMMANVGQLIAATRSDATPDLLPAVELIGASVLRGWYMPDAVVEAVALQYAPPKQNAEVVTPLSVLHSIRYLQANFTNTADKQQRESCAQYLHGFLKPDVAGAWLDAFSAIQQLTAAQSSPSHESQVK